MDKFCHREGRMYSEERYRASPQSSIDSAGRPARNTVRFWVSAFSFLTVASVAYAESCEPLMVQGNEESCACSSSNIADLKAQIKELPEIDSPEDLTKLVNTLLCGKGKKATTILHRHMPKLIAISTFGTGDEQAKIVLRPKSDVTPFGGHAYGASVSAGFRSVAVNFTPNPYCFSIIRFIYKPSGWLLVGHENACD